MLDERFGALPAHFNTAVSSTLNVDLWRDLLPVYDSIPCELKPSLPYLCTALMHHEPYLREHCSGTHPIFYCRVFSGNEHLRTLRSGILTGVKYQYFYFNILNNSMLLYIYITGYVRCEDTGMEATGLPPHVLQCTKMNEMKVCMCILCIVCVCIYVCICILYVSVLYYMCIYMYLYVYYM